jgi:pectinesterase
MICMSRLPDPHSHFIQSIDTMPDLFQNCHLHSVAKTFGSVTAQKRNESHMNTGFSFVDAAITGSGPIYLGRAWGNYSRTVYSYTWMDNIVYPPGWSDFGFSDRQT